MGRTSAWTHLRHVFGLQMGPKAELNETESGRQSLQLKLITVFVSFVANWPPNAAKAVAVGSFTASSRVGLGQGQGQALPFRGVAGRKTRCIDCNRDR